VRGGTDDIYHALPFREHDVHDAILGSLRAGDVLVDCGANIGYYSILGARAVGCGGMVISVEAMPDTAAQLRDNIRLNDIETVTIVRQAIQDDAAVESVEFRVKGGQYGAASYLSQSDSKRAERVTVAATTIDQICDSNAHIRLIKLDLEGAELAALSGATKTLRKTDFVVVECNQAESQISALLGAAGFAIKRLDFTSYILAYRPTNVLAE
jgi:FkbM family methyltransferase